MLRALRETLAGDVGAFGRHREPGLANTLLILGLLPSGVGFLFVEPAIGALQLLVVLLALTRRFSARGRELIDENALLVYAVLIGLILLAFAYLLRV